MDWLTTEFITNELKRRDVYFEVEQDTDGYEIIASGNSHRIHVDLIIFEPNSDKAVYIITGPFIHLCDQTFAAGYKQVNRLNFDYKDVKFLVLENHKGITAFCRTERNQNARELAVSICDMIDRVQDIIDDEYQTIMRSLWSMEEYESFITSNDSAK